jgi:hypothetical protein
MTGAWLELTAYSNQLTAYFGVEHGSLLKVQSLKLKACPVG